MSAKVVIVLAVCWLRASASVSHLESAPIVAATSSQYFARTYNRLLEAPSFIVAPPPQVFPPALVPAPPQPAAPPAETPNVAARPTENVDPRDPNVAIATAQAAPLVEPFYLVQIPGGEFASRLQFLPSGDTGDSNFGQDQQTTTQTTVSSNSNFESTSNFEITKTSTRSGGQNNQLTQDNTENLQEDLQQQHRDLLIQQQLLQQEYFVTKQLLLQQQQLVRQLHQEKQQSLIKQQHQQQQKSPVRTSVEVVPVPLAYIAPPPIRLSSPIRQFHSFVPPPVRLVRLPIPYRQAPLRNQNELVPYSAPAIGANRPGVLQSPRSREVEPTTLRAPSFDDVTRPPRK